MTEEEAALLRKESAANKLRITELETAQRTATANTALAANTAFAEQMATETRILPVQVAQVVAIAGHLDAAPVEFGEGDAKKPLGKVFQDFVRGLAPLVNTGEKATRERAVGEADDGEGDVAFAEGADPERLKQHKAALAYAKEHKTSYAVAARAVIK